VALSLVGDRWTLLVVEALQGGADRYGQLAAAVAGISPNILADRLKRLERDGLVLAEPYSMRPPRFRYELTAAGQELAGAVAPLADWAARHEGVGETDYHRSCGTTLEVRLWCPTCERVVEATEADDVTRL
jgi:DNA-binding HxlR family transcriptional regulator